jgi:septum formation protein
MAEIAIELARCKAQEVSQRYPEAVVIGADQTLELDGTGFDKPRNGEEAREQLLRLRGRVHNLHSALCCCRSADVVWQHRSMATLAMRRFSEDELTWYIKQAGDKLTQSVGGYQVEGPAIQLFSSIEGDYFTILGLPMLPLLEFLRGQGFLQR